MYRNAVVVGARDAMDALVRRRAIARSPLHGQVAAVSVGIVGGVALLDLPYVEDSKAEVDMNVVMTGNGEFVELQGTGEEATFSYNDLQGLLGAAQEGLMELFELQKAALGEEITQKIESRRKK